MKMPVCVIHLVNVCLYLASMWLANLHNAKRHRLCACVCLGDSHEGDLVSQSA